MGCIYMWTNKVNGKRYVGKCHVDVESRKNDHIAGRGSKPLKNAFAKYGIESFDFEILHDGILDAFLDDYEIEAIKKYDTLKPNGYNLRSGGGRGKHSKETIRKMSDSKKGVKFSAEHRRKISEVQKGRTPWNKGKKGVQAHSAETRQKMSNAQKGKPKSPEHNKKVSEASKGKKLSAETRRKISEAHKGKKRKPHSAETRQKISKANKGKPRTPEARRKLSEAHKGKKHSVEHRRKISEAHKGKPRSKEHRKNLSKSLRHPDYNPAYDLFCSLSCNMSNTEKRKVLFKSFPNVSETSIYEWTRKWQSEIK